MMGIGALALKSELLRDINQEVRHQVLSTNPNVNNTLENRLRHVPTFSTFILLPALGVRSKHNLLDKSLVYVLATTVANHTVDRLKSSSKELRPDGSDRRSFPSGHTTTAFIAAEFMRKEYKDVSPWLGVAAYSVATATGALRVYHNKHWLTDVIAGAGLGILSTDLAYLIHAKTKAFSSKVSGGKKLSLLPSFQYNNIGFTLAYCPN
jgi:membrane-associated phospholipid phosphatase